MNGEMLKKIRIKGFRSIRNASVDLGNINILIGSNGSGKSNFLSAFAFVRKIISLELQRTVSKRGVKSLLYDGPDETEEIAIDALFENNSYGFSLKLTEEERLMFSDEYFCQEHSGMKYSLGSGHFESKLKDCVKDNAEPFLSVKSWCVYHFNDTSATSLMKRSCSTYDNVTLLDDARNIAPFLLRLKEEYPSDYRKIVSTIRLAAPFFEDFVLIPNNDAEDVMLRWKKIDNDGIMGPNQLSDGTLRFICLTTLLLQPKELRPMTMIFDEPELGLYPQAMVYLAEMIKSVGKTGQIIVSTQSADLLDEFSPDDIITVRDDGNGTEFSRLELEKLKDWLEDGHSLGQLWKKNLLN